MTYNNNRLMRWNRRYFLLLLCSIERVTCWIWMRFIENWLNSIQRLWHRDYCHRKCQRKLNTILVPNFTVDFLFCWPSHRHSMWNILFDLLFHVYSKQKPFFSLFFSFPFQAKNKSMLGCVKRETYSIWIQECWLIEIVENG